MLAEAFNFLFIIPAVCCYVLFLLMGINSVLPSVFSSRELFFFLTVVKCNGKLANHEKNLTVRSFLLESLLSAEVV